jgi:hypothetical protein
MTRARDSPVRTLAAERETIAPGQAAIDEVVEEDRGDRDLAAACGRVRLDQAGC